MSQVPDIAEKVSDDKVCQAPISVKLRWEVVGPNNTQQIQFLKKYCKRLARNVLIKNVHGALGKLEQKRFVFTKMGSKLKATSKTLIKHEPSFKKIADDLINKLHLAEFLLNYRASRKKWRVAKKLLVESVPEYTEFDPERNTILLMYMPRFASELYARRLVEDFKKGQWILTATP